ncbi:MAG TPA: class I SAM-dependent methyltransferase [Thermoleophilaceae bacterium]|nr:class I SAM-dependent methyltransferase [Thermoleophilaceae bacterium]
MASTVRDRVQDLLGRRDDAQRFERRWGFAPPPEWSDRVGYEVLLEEIERHRLDRIEGDVLEIGALLGGGTAKLCGWFARSAPAKRVIAVDVFDPAFDKTITAAGWTMEELYANWVGDRDQRAVFDDVTKGCTNLDTITGDSAAIELPAERLAFAFVDGNHAPDYVRSDFELVWQRLTPGGIAAFHDYGGDLPAVTSTLHRCIGDHADEIARVWTRPPTVLLVERRS